MTGDEFRRRARDAAASGARRLVPLSREILFDGETPVSAFAKLRREGSPFAFLLESAPAGGETWARYSFLGSAPRAVWRLTDGIVEDWTPERGWHSARTPKDPLSDLEAIVERYEPVDSPEDGEFWSGAVGFFSYDVVRLIERLPHAPKKAVKAPDALFVFTGALVIIDNLRSQARIVVGVPIDPGMSEEQISVAHRSAGSEIDRTVGRLRAAGSLPAFDL